MISSYTISPTTFKSPPTVTIPAIETPPCGWIVTPDPTLNVAPSNVS